MDLETVDHLLTTTRTVRERLDLERPVELDTIQRCIEIAFQAPTAGNVQNWDFVVVTDAALRRELAALYVEAADQIIQRYSGQPYSKVDLRTEQLPRLMESGIYLKDHLHEVPVHVVPCVEARVEDAGVMMQATMYGSILPAVWSFMLALRSRGIGAAWTTDHLMYEKEAAQLLGIPDQVTQVALLPVAYFKGTDFKPAKTLPTRENIHFDKWGVQPAA
jgi:nitroreductase